MGVPKNYEKKNIKEYLLYPWQHEHKPDFVLIDGRFRVACFLTSLKLCNVGTNIIFDDYFVRPHYHIVEEIIKPIKSFGRQALFEVNNLENLDKNLINKLLEKFEYVME